MPAGKYWIGDLCYVMHEHRDEVCKLAYDGSKCLEGKFKLNNGIEFVLFSTAYGDGSYDDDKYNQYGVDSGSIGAILLENINLDDGENDLKDGKIHQFDTEWVAQNDDGVMRFGKIIIDTKNTDSEDYDYEDDEE